MPRVLIVTDAGEPTLDERIQPADFTSEHFRRCLVDRLRWATEDAERLVRDATATEAETDDRHARRSHTAERPARARRGGRAQLRSRSPRE